MLLSAHVCACVHAYVCIACVLVCVLGRVQYHVLGDKAMFFVDNKQVAMALSSLNTKLTLPGLGRVSFFFFFFPFLSPDTDVCLTRRWAGTIFMLSLGCQPVVGAMLPPSCL